MEDRFVYCPECGRAFPSQTGLERHLETAHRIDKDKEDPASEHQSEAQGVFCCPDCGIFFESQQLLVWHRQGVHGLSGPPPSPREATELSRSSNRKIGCVMYSVFLVGFLVAGLVFHWDSALLVIGAIGIVVIYVTTLILDERESGWKERTRAEFRNNYEAPRQYLQRASPRVLRTLTREYEARIPEFVEKWRRVALQTAPADREGAEQAIVTIYHTLGLSAPRIVWCTSPLAAGLTRAIAQRLPTLSRPSNNDPIWAVVANRLKEPISQGFWESVRHSVETGWGDGRIGSVLASRLRTDFPGQLSFIWTDQRPEENTWNVAGHLLRSAVGGDIFDRVRELIYPGFELSAFPDITRCAYSSLAAALETTKSETKGDERRAAGSDFAYNGDVIVTDVSSPDQTRFERERVKVRVRNTLGERSEDSVGNSLGASARNSCYGQDDGVFLVFFDYFRMVCGLTAATDGLKGQCWEAQTAGWYLPHQNICWVSERHSRVHLNNDDRLHCEDGPALEYPDGWGIYALNGIMMKPQYVLTSAERLVPQEVLRERNVDVRCELIKKMGMTRLLKYGKEIDRQGNYRLIDMSAVFKGSGIRHAPYLLMDSASVAGAQHLEGVSPECRTVEQAINWRASQVAETWDPDLLS